MSKYYMLKGGPLSNSIVSVSHRRLPWAFNYTVSVTVINKVGLDKLGIVNCMLLPSAKFDVKNACNLVRQLPHAVHMP